MEIIKRGNILIEKLYLDCIDTSRNCFIIYVVRLNFFFIKIFYSALIFSDAEGNIIEKSSLKKNRIPLIDGSMNLFNEALDISGSWERKDCSIINSLRCIDGVSELIWNCHHPKALTKVRFNGKDFKGYGYAETLYLPIKTWNPPIEELRWGRFLSEKYTVIWINWKGKNSVNKIFLNGIEFTDALFHDNNIIFSAGAYMLEFSDIQLLRNGKISNLFAKTPWMKTIFNGRILNAKESKYTAKAILTKNSDILATDWSLFETVTWKE